MQEYFCMSPKVRRTDLDGDGVPDFQLSSGQCHYFCGNFVVFVVFGHGASVALVHVDSDYSAKHELIMTVESAPALEPVTWSQLKPVLVHRACSSHQEQLARDIDAASYTTLAKGGFIPPDLSRAHAQALALFRGKKAAPAVKLLDDYFARVDYRLLDRGRQDPAYTAS